MNASVLYIALVILFISCQKAPIISLKDDNTNITIGVQQIGVFDSSQVAFLSWFISKFFNASAVVLEQIAVPQSAIINKIGALSADLVLAEMVKTNPKRPTLSSVSHTAIFSRIPMTLRNYRVKMQAASL